MHPHLLMSQVVAMQVYFSLFGTAALNTGPGVAAMSNLEQLHVQDTEKQM